MPPSPLLPLSPDPPDTQGGTYEGDWVNRVPHGQGRMVYSDGSIYIGGWQNFKYHGFGKVVQEGGVVFEGEWREGCMHGLGCAKAMGAPEVVEGHEGREVAGYDQKTEESDAERRMTK